MEKRKEAKSDEVYRKVQKLMKFFHKNKVKNDIKFSEIYLKMGSNLIFKEWNNIVHIIHMDLLIYLNFSDTSLEK